VEAASEAIADVDPALVHSLVWAVLGQSAEVRVTGCAREFYDQGAVERALAVVGVAEEYRLYLSLVDCSDRELVRLDLVLRSTEEVETSTVSLADVSPAFRYRTLAHLASDLAATRRERKRRRPVVAPSTTPKVSARSPDEEDLSAGKTKSLIGIETGAVFRPTGGTDEQLSVLPQVGAVFALDVASPVRLHFRLVYETGSSVRHRHHGVRLGLQPSWMIELGPVVLSLGIEGRAGLVHLAGSKDSAIARASVRGVASLGGAVSIEWEMVRRLVLRGGVAAGYEYGVEGIDLGRHQFSTHGLFVTPSVAISFGL
jgi:hypothetical protein